MTVPRAVPGQLSCNCDLRRRMFQALRPVDHGRLGRRDLEASAEVRPACVIRAPRWLLMNASQSYAGQWIEVLFEPLRRIVLV